MGKALVVVDECTSTNNIAVEMAENGAPDGLVVIARTQTAGRGRLGRDWCSPRGGIWMTILSRTSRPDYMTSLPLIGALGITKALVDTLSVNARVRWPNDVVVEGRKVAGVLAEAKSAGDQLTHVVLGMGVNANFDTKNIAAISQTSTSLSTILGHQVDLAKVISTILETLERLLETLQTRAGTEMLELVRLLDSSRGTHVQVKTSKATFDGLLVDYESLTKVRIMTENGPVIVDTDSVLSVDYQSD